MTKPTQTEVEDGLDSMIARAINEPTKKHFKILEMAIDDLESIGYPLQLYREISQELRKEYL